MGVDRRVGYVEYDRLELEQPHYGPVNAYRIGDTLVDTGHVCEASRDRLLTELDGGRLSGIDRVVLTHSHVDHVGGSLTIPELTDLPHVVYEGCEGILADYPAYLRAARSEWRDLSTGLLTTEKARAEQRAANDEYFPLDRAYEDPRIDRVASAGDRVQVGDYECEVIHTPGHARQHMSLYHPESGVVVSGDIVSVNGHFMYGPLYWDIGAYKTGLRRLRERDPDLLLPGHGAPMDEPLARIEDALEKATQAESAILDAVAAEGPLPAHELAVRALGASDETVGFLTFVAAAYVVHLGERGILDVERRPNVVAHPV